MKFNTATGVVVLSTLAALLCAQPADAALYTFSFSNVDGPVSGTVQGQVSLPDGNGKFAATGLIITAAPAALGYTLPVDAIARWTVGFGNSFTVSDGTITVGSFAATTESRTDGFFMNFLPEYYGTFLSPINAGAGNFFTGVVDVNGATLSFGVPTPAPEPGSHSLIGRTVQVEMNFDGFPYATNSGTVTSNGLDFPAGSFSGYGPDVYVTVGTDSITFGNGPGHYTVGSFNGPIYTISPATSLAVTLQSSDLPGFDQSLISVIGNTISLNFSGLEAPNGTLVTIGVVVDPATSVPEPASIALLGAGLLGLGFGRRRAG